MKKCRPFTLLCQCLKVPNHDYHTVHPHAIDEHLLNPIYLRFPKISVFFFLGVPIFWDLHWELPNWGKYYLSTFEASDPRACQSQQPKSNRPRIGAVAQWSTFGAPDEGAKLSLVGISNISLLRDTRIQLDTAVRRSVCRFESCVGPHGSS